MLCTLCPLCCLLCSLGVSYTASQTWSLIVLAILSICLYLFSNSRAKDQSGITLKRTQELKTSTSSGYENEPKLEVNTHGVTISKDTIYIIDTKYTLYINVSLSVFPLLFLSLPCWVEDLELKKQSCLIQGDPIESPEAWRQESLLLVGRVKWRLWDGREMPWR